MPRPSRPWFRVYVEMFPDRKIRRLTPAQRWIWVALMGAARESPRSPALYVSDDLPMTYREIADYADVKEREVLPALQAMARLGMVQVSNDDVVSLPNFAGRQFDSDDVTRRTRAHRERSKSDATERSNERSNDVPGNAPETETETETEKPSGPRRRGTRIDANWRPPPTEVDWRRENGISDFVARRELPKFIDYWTAQPSPRGVKLDWLATWRNWLRNAQERESTPPGQRPANGQVRPQDVMGALSKGARP